MGGSERPERKRQHFSRMIQWLIVDVGFKQQDDRHKSICPLGVVVTAHDIFLDGLTRWIHESN